MREKQKGYPKLSGLKLYINELKNKNIGTITFVLRTEYIRKTHTHAHTIAYIHTKKSGKNLPL